MKPSSFTETVRAANGLAKNELSLRISIMPLCLIGLKQNFQT